jgi:serine/threonine-protein kinase
MTTDQHPKPAAVSLLNEPQPGDILDGRFKILQIINRGGMAWIYQALDRTTGETVAVKIPLMQCESQAGFYDRFQREEAIGLTLEHPYVVKFVWCGVAKCRPYIVMEYLEGRTLAARLNETSPLPESEIARIASQICGALDYLHRKGIIHRDLKPENIMLCDDKTIRIMDFGIAKSAQARRLTFGGFSSTVGTPDYIAPEQVEGKRGDARTDIYSLGAMLYVMTTGAAPYEGDSAYVVMNARLSGDPEAPRKKNPQISLPMEEIVLHAMERDPAKRFHSALAMKAELDDYAKVTLEGRFKKVQMPHFLAVRHPLVRNMVIIVACQILFFVLLFCYFSHRHPGARNHPFPPPPAQIKKM